MMLSSVDDSTYRCKGLQVALLHNNRLASCAGTCSLRCWRGALPASTAEVTHARTLGAGLEDCKFVRTLRLDNNRLVLSGFRGILEKCFSLVELDVSFNRITSLCVRMTV
ncbi:leucine-rich repeat domain-containing protein [archaeon]|nr:MAG: leucine-rich repeat domain-containing protein [archaeon]